MKMYCLAGVLMLGVAGAAAIAADAPAGRAGAAAKGQADGVQAGRGKAAGGGAKGAARADAAARKAAAKAGAATPKKDGEAMVDKREANQERRIEQGIKKDQLTDSEVDKLKGLETNIDSMEGTFKSDGKLSKNELKQLRQALNDASLQIWSERHDTEGSQKPVSRLGKDIFAKDDLTGMLESGSLTRTQAKAFLKDFHEMVSLKRRLATENLSAEERTKLQAEYNDLLNKYFLIRNGTAANTAKIL